MYLSQCYVHKSIICIPQNGIGCAIIVLFHTYFYVTSAIFHLGDSFFLRKIDKIWAEVTELADEGKIKKEHCLLHQGISLSSNYTLIFHSICVSMPNSIPTTSSICTAPKISSVCACLSNLTPTSATSSIYIAPIFSSICSSLLSSTLPLYQAPHIAQQGFI